MFSYFEKPNRTGSQEIDRPTIVVVGNGIASIRFCEEAVALGLNCRKKIVVVGGESYPAYDRVRLSSYIKQRSADSLIIRTVDWYAENGIELLLNDPAVSLTCGEKALVTASGKRIEYHELVIATGSSAYIPPIPGADLPKVHVYRNIRDLELIIESSENATKALVIGGGLLGLEAAQALQYLGLQTDIVERSSFPMPKQLNQTAGELLKNELAAQSIGFIPTFSSREIRSNGDRLQLVSDHDRLIDADLIVISAGIRPNSELARSAGIPCGVNGGIIVDDHLETGRPEIHSIGEVALLHGKIHGLAAPAAAMARHVARRLAGRKPAPFPTPDPSTRLKMLGVDVISIGTPLDQGNNHEFTSEGIYRLIVLDGNGRITGALAIGDWPEASAVQSWYSEGRAFNEKRIQQFLSTGILDPDAAGQCVTMWPDERYVCNCVGVTKGKLLHAMADGARDAPALTRCTGAGSVCGSCQPLLARLCGASSMPVSPAGTRLLLVVSGIALAAAVLTAGMPRFPAATTVQGLAYQLDWLWSATLPKQVTGYSLLALCLLGLLLSLRKRLPRFRFGAFTKWRAFHAVFGLLSLAVLFAHTGFRFGANLNAMLMSVFVGLNLLGSVAGIAAACETRGGPRISSMARRYRPALTTAHYILFWPLPVLLTFHIIAAYIY